MTSVHAGSRRFLNPPTMPDAFSFGYSQAAETVGGRTIYIAGQVGFDRSGSLVAGGIAEQALQTFRNIESALAAADASFEDVVKLGIFMKDVADFAQITAARDRFIDLAAPPASIAVQVVDFVVPGILVEVDAIAHVA